MPRSRKRVFTSNMPDANVYFPFGRKPELKGGKLTNPVCFTEEPCGWPQMEFKSSKPEGDKIATADVQKEEPFDKYSPAEKTVDTDSLIYQYVALMHNLERSRIGMCCDRVFYDELRYLKKSIVPRRPNCPMLVPSNELNIFGLEAVKPPDIRRRRPPSPPIVFRKPKNPFDVCNEDMFPKRKPFVIAPNRKTRRVAKSPFMTEFFQDPSDCAPSRRVKTHGCY
uniref:Sulfate adenylyltransferase n=1 Tax=Lygus hesperus TaxID=30085 RepID=A0A0A9X509_LYGHE